jgi:DNA-binding MarR family transcriptional regulator
MAAHARIPKSYLSKVLGKRADLSADQMHLVCDYLRFDAEARDYMQLLLDHDRASLAARKAELARRIRAIQARYLKTSAYVQAETVSSAASDLSDYYLDPIHQILHVAAGVPRLGESLERLAAEMALPPQRLLAIMTRLEEMGFVERDATSGRYRTVRKNLHLPRDSKLFKAWRNQLRSLSLTRLDGLESEQSYSFTAVFTGSETLRRDVQTEILSMIGGIEKKVGASEKTGVYQLAIDLFPWTRPV